jgi:hypothetical protein
MLLSQIDKARHSTVFTRATTTDLDRLSFFYDLVRPASFPRVYWAKVMQAIVYQPKGTYAQLFNVLYWSFKPWTDQETYENVLISTEGRFVLPTGDLSDGRVHKLVRCTFTDGSVKIYMVYQIHETGTPPIVVRRYQLFTDQTHASNSMFSVYTRGQSVTVKTMEFLPFLIFETTGGGLGNLNALDDLRNGKITIYLDSTLAKAPPTYMKEDNEERDAGEPFGGQLLELFDLDPDTENYGDQINGPFPLYLGGSQLEGVFGTLLDKCISAGIKYELINQDWDTSLGYQTLNIYAQQGIYPFPPKN